VRLAMAAAELEVQCRRRGMDRRARRGRTTPAVRVSRSVVPTRVLAGADPAARVGAPFRAGGGAGLAVRRGRAEADEVDDVVPSALPTSCRRVVGGWSAPWRAWPTLGCSG
jgi:hypothetical protein